VGQGCGRECGPGPKTLQGFPTLGGFPAVKFNWRNLIGVMLWIEDILLVIKLQAASIRMPDNQKKIK